ncbi:hypothetical protein [Thermanaeromonas sp.]|uniref:hypothetical protein n=1 Tax=Thermanaeromonas sp. TaxID=2003697 RepID=UPI002605BEAA|nr:hypothetical protein [Thermanaeromonas sp.]
MPIYVITPGRPGAKKAWLKKQKFRNIIDMALEAGIIEKRGTWFVWGEERLGQGKENTRTYLKENPQVLEALSKALQEKLGALVSTKTFQAAGEEGVGEGLS